MNATLNERQRGSPLDSDVDLPGSFRIVGVWDTIVPGNLRVGPVDQLVNAMNSLLKCVGLL